MINIEREKKKLELLKVETGVAELEFKILERMNEIERIKLSIDVAKENINKIKGDLEKME